MTPSPAESTGHPGTGDRERGEGGASPALSVVIATYARPTLLALLLGDLAKQTVHGIEVVVVDDGSPTPVADSIDPASYPFALRIERQPNAGPAAARHRGALLASADLVAFFDDDMRLPPRALAAHLAAHAAGRVAAVGKILASTNIERAPIFERFHADQLARHYAGLEATGRAPVGTELCTGNMSLRRADYVAVGGFDRTLGRSEDAELGVRLEKAGVRLVYVPEAESVHDSDHADAGVWLRRAYLYGLFEERIAKKHPDVPGASPWHWFGRSSRAAHPVLVFALVAPDVAGRLVEPAMSAAVATERVGLERLALKAANLAYAVQYMRGFRAEAGSLAGLLESRGAFCASSSGGRGDGRPTRAEEAVMKILSALRHARKAIVADHDMLRGYDDKYASGRERRGSLPYDLVSHIGFQMMVGYRLMRLFREAGIPLAPQVVSRLVRFIYGADIHYDAELADGVVIVHGMGLGISGLARVGRGAILSHNVSLGEGIDPVTRAVGSPRLEERVHVGPNAVLLGPITIGEGSKIMAGAVVRRSVPPSSIVETPEPRIAPRAISQTSAAAAATAQASAAR